MIPETIYDDSKNAQSVEAINNEDEDQKEMDDDNIAWILTSVSKTFTTMTLTMSTTFQCRRYYFQCGGHP